MFTLAEWLAWKGTRETGIKLMRKRYNEWREKEMDKVLIPRELKIKRARMVVSEALGLSEWEKADWEDFDEVQKEAKEWASKEGLWPASWNVSDSEEEMLETSQ